MFGLGGMEMLIIGAAIMWIAGPIAGPKLLQAVRSSYEAKSGITGASGLGRLVEIDEAIESLADRADPDDEPADDP